MDTPKRWFEAVVRGGHAGAGRSRESVIYLYALDEREAMQILLSKTRGWKKGRARGLLSFKECTPVVVEGLPAKIIGSSRVSVEKVLEDGFFYDNGE